MIYIERCSKCKRLIAIRDIPKEELWLLEEEIKSWRKVCWPCRCKEKVGIYDHMDLIEYRGCGCM